MRRILSCFGIVLSLGISSCIGGNTSVVCERPVQEKTTASKEFTLKKEGGSFEYLDWTVSVEAGVLKEDVKLLVEEKSGSDLSVKVPHDFVTQNGQKISVVNHHPPSQLFPPLLIKPLTPVEYLGDKTIVATLSSSAVPVEELTVFQNEQDLAKPDFSKPLNDGRKTFSIALDGPGWLYVLAHESEGLNQCLVNSVDDIAKQIGDQIEVYVDDPCKACQSIAEVVADVENCKQFVNNVTNSLCEAFKAEKGKESWSDSITQHACQGATWLAGWVASYAFSAFGESSSPVDEICKNADTLKTFLEKYDARADCMCELFLRDPRCQKQADTAQCNSLWATVAKKGGGKGS